TGALSSLFRTHTRHTHHRTALSHTSTHDPPPCADDFDLGLQAWVLGPASSSCSCWRTARHTNTRWAMAESRWSLSRARSEPASSPPLPGTLLIYPAFSTAPAPGVSKSPHTPHTCNAGRTRCL